MAKIDPKTGLIEGTTPVEKTGDPVADRLLAKQSIASGRGVTQHAVGVKDMSYKVSPRDPLSRYQKYGVTNLLPGGDWDEERAQRQSTSQKWANGLAKAAVTTIGAIAENTLGNLRS